MKFLLGTKEYMTQLFDEEGRVYPATVIQAGPVHVTQVKTKAKEGYSALQFGFGKKRKVSKPIAGHTKELGNLKVIKELRLDDDAGAEITRGQSFDVTVFNEGDKIVVTGTSKGKGFQGVIKRHGFHGGPRSHGQKHSERAPGSLGSAGNQRVFPGLRMGGRMGSDTITVKNLKVLKIDKDRNEMVISGTVPGRKGTLLEIKGS
ncbi:MAG: 50S ribosomal protein L3 [Candidatus Vogelbacteria bacterium]|nr:50S ribosomal protein L3 [Candidatus Vogelbacteria bacterium]